MPPTHQVLNQPPPLQDYDPFTTDPVLPGAVERAGAGWARNQLTAFGRRVGSAEVFEWGFWPTAIPRCCAPTTDTATASTRWSTTPLGTTCSTWR